MKTIKTINNVMLFSNQNVNTDKITLKLIKDKKYKFVHYDKIDHKLVSLSQMENVINKWLEQNKLVYKLIDYECSDYNLNRMQNFSTVINLIDDKFNIITLEFCDNKFNTPYKLTCSINYFVNVSSVKDYIELKRVSEPINYICDQLIEAIKK